MMALCVAVAFILSKHNPSVYMEGRGGKQGAECGFPDHAGWFQFHLTLDKNLSF